MKVTKDNQANGAFYRRIFEVRETGIGIESNLTSDGTQQVNELWEIIPAFLGEREADVDNAKTKIYFEVNDDFVKVYENQVSEDTSLFENVSGVGIVRFEDAAYIHFSEPRSVKIAEHDYPLSGPATSRNVMVDLLAGNSTLPTGIYSLNHVGNSRKHYIGTTDEHRCLNLFLVCYLCFLCSSVVLLPPDTYVVH